MEFMNNLFFGGGYYYKISKKENESKYKFEMCHSEVPNDVPKGEKYIKNSFNGILGLAIGDAIGVPIEFVSRDTLLDNPITEMREYGSHKVPKGTWSDDTSMTLATMDSIKNTEKIDCTDIANNFLKWFKDAEYTATGDVFDIGRTTLRALAKFEESRNPFDCGESNELSNGNGSLMRILPIAYYCYYQGRNV